ncbi:MAG: roadblock/LC7 domain-containing protein [Candidatus Methylacidiphilales bacterium]|nr:roadblock/LC7 domain-containing protein [Candidatus Methylacidiphilales bacterium]
MAIGMLSVEDQVAIECTLKEFLAKSESQWTAVVDKGGNLFAEMGDIGTLDISILSALAAGSFAATRELARRLGEQEFTALYHEGSHISILMTALQFDCLLITVFGDKTNIGLVRFYAQQTTPALDAALSNASENEAQAGPLELDTDLAQPGGGIIR